MKDRYFITGGSGFVGANLARFLVKGGAHVALLLRNKKLNWRLADLKGAFTVYEGDMLTANFTSIFKREKPSVIFHLAAYGAMPQHNDFEEMMNVNVNGLARLLSAGQKSSVRVFVNTGSSSEYGVKKKKMKETDLLLPVNDYGISKASATMLAQKTAMNTSFSLVTLRLFSPYGYFEQPTRFIPSLIQAVKLQNQFSASSPTFVRDFVFIEDVVQAYMSVVNTRTHSINGQVINIGSGRQHSLGDIVSNVEKIMKRHIDVRWNIKNRQARQVEPAVWEADIQTAKKLLRWKPTITLEEGLKKTIQHSNPS